MAFNSQQSSSPSLLSVGITIVMSGLALDLMLPVHTHYPKMSSQACLLTSWFEKSTYTAALSLVRKCVFLVCVWKKGHACGCKRRSEKTGSLLPCDYPRDQSSVLEIGSKHLYPWTISHQPFSERDFYIILLTAPSVLSPVK